MNRLKKPNLDFLLTDIPKVIDFLNEVDNSQTGQDAHKARQSSRSYETAVVRLLPLAKTNVRLQ